MLSTRFVAKRCAECYGRLAIAASRNHNRIARFLCRSASEHF